MLTFDFEWFSSEVHCELETKTVSNFPHFLSSPTVTLQVLFPTIFPDRSTIIKYKKIVILTFQYLRDASLNSFETSEYYFFIPKKHIELKGKNVYILVH